MLVFTGEFPGVGAWLRMWRAIGVTFQGDGRRADHRGGGEPLLQLVVFPLAVGQAEPPAVIMDHDVDMIRVVEGRRAAIEGGIVELPLRRGDLPDEPGEV